MKILVTGASGFIGGRLLTSLIDRFGKDSVVAFTSKEIADVNCIVYRSITEFNVANHDFSAFTHLIHAGAFTPKSGAQSNDIYQCNNNILFTEKLLSLVFKKLKRIIFLSTLDVYAADGIISETSKVSPASLYGYSKLYCEAMIKTFSAQHKIDFMNLRVGHVYGPGEEKYKKILPITIKKLIEDQSTEIWGDGTELRSFIYIDDVIEAIVNAVSHHEKNLDINIVSGRPISIKELVEKLILISGVQTQVKHIESNHLTRDLVFDNTRLKNTLLPQEIDLDTGLTIEYKYMKSLYEPSI